MWSDCRAARSLVLERHTWRAEVLAFIHDHIDPAEVYRLGEADLLFAELLPEKPTWMQTPEALNVKLPASASCQYAYVLRIEMK